MKKIYLLIVLMIGLMTLTGCQEEDCTQDAYCQLVSSKDYGKGVTAKTSDGGTAENPILLDVRNLNEDLELKSESYTYYKIEGTLNLNSKELELKNVSLVITGDLKGNSNAGVEGENFNLCVSGSIDDRIDIEDEHGTVIENGNCDDTLSSDGLEFRDGEVVEIPCSYVLPFIHTTANGTQWYYTLPNER